MIITQTPLRISLAGGGTDFAGFYQTEEGCVVSSAIDKYIYVIIKERFDDKIRVGYSRTEMVDSVDQIEHELVRECLRRTGIDRGVEISTMADIPSEGSGLGSSSAVTVGLLNAMYTHVGDPRPHEALAREACEIEIDVLGKPIGKQDQYITAFGNLRFTRFLELGDVVSEVIDIDPDPKARLSSGLMLFFTGMTRSSDGILSDQKKNLAEHMATLRAMKDQALDARRCIVDGDFDCIGAIMNHGWQHKKLLAGGVSSDAIDDMYDRALTAGALGGKIAGAGGGGFLLLYCPQDRHAQVRSSMREIGLKELHFRLERDGTKVVLNVRR